MSQEFITLEVNKIMANKKFEYPLNMAMASAWILGNLKGINLKIFDVSHTSSLADFYILASATSSTQANAMASSIQEHLKRKGMSFISKEGINKSDWILLDGGDIIVHIFQETARNVYEIESLWKEAQPIQIPNDYYFSNKEEIKIQENSEDNKKDRHFF